MTTPTKRTYIILTDDGCARVFLKHTAEMFAAQIASMTDDWDNVVILPKNPSKWPQWVFLTPNGKAYLGYGKDRATAVLGFLKKHPQTDGFTICFVAAIAPGELILVRVGESLHLVEPAEA